MPVRVTDYITTTSPIDTYPTHDAVTGKGGHRTAETYNDMLAIPEARRTPGMQVHVRDTDKLYKLSPTSGNWKTINNTVTISASTILDDIPVKTAKMYAYAADTQEIYQLQEDLVTWDLVPLVTPDYYTTEVTTLTDRDNIAESDRYLNMVVHVTATDEYYRLNSFSYNAENQFINLELNWTLLDYSEGLYALDELAGLMNIATDQMWPGRKVFVINDTLFAELSRSGNEWSEIPEDETPYFIVETLQDLIRVPPFYRRPGLLVYVESETKLYTRSTGNNSWTAITSDSVPGASAYEVAVENGFVGNEQAWLDSLVGRGITNTIINPITGELEISYSDGTIESVGVVRGERGEDGVGVINIELYDDPTAPGNVYFITELSDGRILQTRDAISGYNGKSIADMFVENNNIIVMLDDGSYLAPVPVSGLSPISIVDVRIEDGDLLIEYSTGEIRSAGAAENLAGRGLLSAAVVEGQLRVEWSDNPGVIVSIGNVNGVVSMAVTEGELFATYANDPLTPVKIGDVNSVVSMEVTEGELFATYAADPSTPVKIGDVNSVVTMFVNDGELFVTYAADPSTPVKLSDLVTFTNVYLNDDLELVFVTTRDAPNNEINIGPVANIKGEPGESIKSVTISNNAFIVGLTDDTVLPAIPVSGLTPISIVSARIEDGDLFFGLTNGSEINAGIVDDLQGRGISNTEVISGQLFIYYDTDPLTPVLVGDVPGIASTIITDGELYVTYTTDVDTPVLVGDVPGIASTIITDGELYVTYTTDVDTPVKVGDVPGIVSTLLLNGELYVTYTSDVDTPVKVGDIKSLESTSIVNGMLKFLYTNGTEEDIGLLRTIASMSISESGILNVLYVDGSSQVLGNVIGPQGPQGYFITGANVDPGGNLKIFTNDPDNLEYIAGFVRTTVQNLMGSTPLFTATAGQTELLVDHDTENALVFVNGVMLAPSEYNLDTADRIILTTPLTAGDSVRVVVYAPGGPSQTGRGVFTVSVDESIYTITLEDGSTFTIDTETPINIEDLPPGIDNIVVEPNGDIRVILTDGSDFIAGSANNAVSITGAFVDEDGNLLIETSDEDNSPINAGSVLSGLQIESAEVDLNGHLIFTTTTGTTFDAGPAANYVTGANISTEGLLTLSMSIGPDIEAGTVRNPLLGMVSDVIAFEGQIEFLLEHNGYDVVVYANGIALSKDRVDLSDPIKVTLLDPRQSGDVIKFMVLYAEEVVASELAGSQLAENDTYYGKDINGNLGFYPVQNIKISQPIDFIATAGQTDFFVAHNGVVEVIKDGVFLMPSQYTLPNYSRVRLVTPASAGDQLRINVLSSPVGTDGLTFDNYARFKFMTNIGGGAALRGAWRPRSLNTIEASTISGALIDRSNMVLPAGTYYVRAWAAANSVGAHAIRLYNTTTASSLLVGDSVFSGVYPSNATYIANTAPQIPNSHAPLEGYFVLPVQSAIQVQHRVLADRYVNSAFGAVGFGFAAITSPSTGSAPRNSSILQEGLGMPATLVDVQVWRVG